LGGREKKGPKKFGVEKKKEKKKKIKSPVID